LIALAVLGLAAQGIRADDFSAPATDNATVQPTGPRMGQNGKDYLNVEGVMNGNFASFGVIDFDSSALGLNGVTDLQSVTISLTQDNASFTHDGPVNFYITEDTTTSIQPDDMAILFDTNDSEGLNGQLSPIHLLGAGNFMQTNSGDLDQFRFALDTDTKAYLIGQINTGGTIRVVITPTDPATAATYAGFSSPDYTGPVITVTTP
jgi:hypothetical protein